MRGNHITSASILSVLRKNQSPVIIKTDDSTVESRIPGKLSSLEPFSKAHLKPSITPTIGFSAYNKRHFSGTMLLANPTGETYRPNCSRKGTR